MNEFCGGVLLAQLRKLDRIVGDSGRTRGASTTASATCPASASAQLPDPAGELGSAVFLGFDSKDQCDRFKAAMKAEERARWAIRAAR